MLLLEAIRGLLDTFESIDIRTAAYFKNNSWYSAIAIIRFRKQSVDEVKKEFENKIKKYGLIQENGFRVDLSCFPISEWESIYQNWNKDFIRHDESLAVNVNRSDELNYSINEPASHGAFNFIDDEWDSYHVSTRGSTSDIQQLIVTYNKNAREHYSRDIYEYLGNILEIAKGSAQTLSFNAITVPLFFRINHISFDKNSVSIDCTGYAQDSVDFVIDLYSWDGYSQHTPLRDKLIKNYKIEGINNSKQDFSVSQTVSIESNLDQFRIDVYRKKDVLIATERGMISMFWPTKSEVTNPFSTVFDKFVTYDQLRKMLIDFKADDMKEPSVIFERGISWLLSLLGLKTIWLGKYEKTGEGANKSSIDILSSDNKNSIILVNVTIGVPDSSDFPRERRYRESIVNLVSNPELKFKSVLFSGASVTSMSGNANDNGITLLGRDELIQIIDYLEKGDIEDARKLIIGNFDRPGL